MSELETQLHREILEQPAAIERLLVTRSCEIARIAGSLRGRRLDYALIAARGSSDNAARYGQYLFGERLGLPVALAAPSLETLYDSMAVPRRGHGLVIAISQSGRSPDVVAVLQAAAEAGAPTIAITNDGRSPLARAAEFILEIGVGPERAIAATKTYTASLAALAALVTELRQDNRDREDLRRVPSLLARTLDQALNTVRRLDRHAAARHVLVVGRGYSYATAMEIALKIRELTATIAEAFSSADLMHGPIAAITEQTLAIAVAPDGRARRSVLESCEALRRLGTPVIMIGATPADLSVPSAIPEWLSPIVTVAPGQVLALRRAILSNRPVDQPPGLTKVTETY